MKAVTVMLVLAISGSQSHMLPQDPGNAKWEETTNQFWEYISDLNTKTDEAMENIRSSQLSRELSSLFKDAIADLTMYKDDIETKLGPYAQDVVGQLGKDLQQLGTKLSTDMAVAKERANKYTQELQAMMEQNVDDVKNRVNLYSRKLKKRLAKDTEEIHKKMVTYFEEMQSRTAQNIDAVKDRLQPYVVQIHDSGMAKMANIQQLLQSQALDLSRSFGYQVEDVREQMEQMEQTTKGLQSSLEEKFEELKAWFKPYVTTIHQNMQTFMTS